MPRTNIPLDGFYESDSLPIANQQLVNWYVNIPQTQGALSQSTLFGGAGLTEVATSGVIDQVNRGSRVKNGIPYFVNGNKLFRLDRSVLIDRTETFELINLGVIPGEGRVSMSDNGTQLIIIADGKGFIFNENAVPAFQEITAPGFTSQGTPKFVVFIQSVFVLTTDTRGILESDVNDGLSWNPLNFFTAEADPDIDNVPVVFNNRLYILGSQTLQAYTTQGAIVGGASFQAIQDLVLPKGITSPFSVINTNDTFMWIGGGFNESPAVWSLRGNQVVKVSTTAIDFLLQDITPDNLANIFAYTYAKNGAYFVGFTGDLRTFEFNTITNKWNERKSRLVDQEGNTVEQRWRPNSVVSAFNRILVGDFVDGRIGVLNQDVYTEYGMNINRRMSTAPFADQGNPIAVPQLEAKMESGVGTATLDPQLRLSIARDGKTFKDELWRGLGKIGESFRRTIWTKLGKFTQTAVFQFEYSENAKPIFIYLKANARGGQVGN